MQLKDYATLHIAVVTLGETSTKGILPLDLGEPSPDERIGKLMIPLVDPAAKPREVANYYLATDSYLHAARADTFPNTFLEALACGTAATATAVGSIPEKTMVASVGYWFRQPITVPWTGPSVSY